ncbi:hypothetical protein EV421DRAFT_1719293 [Armillaria borealis]|uniref:Uncharacterized protein n=1 Tax=Armillaria borealis TaxID=47425 RepID=A0AA39J006_9AGAR|nr:hypothetical protein EV421DRAFT_1719293 [Armillaria borealis]
MSRPTLPLPQLQRGWAKGEWQTFLHAELPPYAQKCALGPKPAAECMATVVNKYFVLYHWCLPLNQEPNAHDVFPDNEDLTDDELESKTVVINQIGTAIKNWLESSGSALALMKKKISQDPVAAFLQQLSVKEPARQHALMVQQLWSKANFVGPLKIRFEHEFEALMKPKKHHAAAHASFVAKAFAELPEEEQKLWKAKAPEDVDEVKCGKDEVVPGLSLLPPEEAQKAIDNIRAILVLLAEGIAKMLGMQVHIVLAGPKPHKGGQLNIIGIHKGVDESPIPRRFESAGGSVGRKDTNSFWLLWGIFL